MKLSLPILQSISLREPAIRLVEGDYSAFERYTFPTDQEPTYLRDVYGVQASSGFDLGKFMREDFKFEDSTNNEGVQIADLLAAGIRRCLRNQFWDNRTAARLIRSLTVENRAKKPPIELVTLSGRRAFVDDCAAEAISLMDRFCRPMIPSSPA